MKTRTVLMSLALLTFALFSLAYAQTSTTVTVKDLFENKDRYDGKVVTVTGAALQYVEKTSSSGQPYTAFLLSDAATKKAIEVVATGHRGIKRGAKVQVTGTFHKNKKIEDRLLKPGIEAQKILPAQ